MAGFEVRGADDVDALVKRLRKHGDAKAIRKEMYQGLNRATKGIRADMQASIAPSLPSRGGLAALVAGRTRLSTSAISGRNAGVRINARNKAYNLRQMNAGKVRHKVFGHLPWVTQTAGINPGFLDEPFEKSSPAVRREVQRVMNEIARKVEG